MQSGSYDFIAQERVIYGIPAAEAVAAEAERWQARRVLLVSGRTLNRSTDVLSTISHRLGERCIGVFDETREHVPLTTVLELATRVRADNPDLIVTVGGGTPVDTVKVMLIALAEEVTEAADLIGYRIRTDAANKVTTPPIKPPPVRQIVVPTTLSGAEFSSLGGAVDPQRQVKDLYTAREVCARTVILDPAVTVHTPASLWLATGLRAVDHAVETICSAHPQPFTDATCLHSLKLFASSLRRNHRTPEDLEGRLESQLAVWLATTGLGRIPWGASHGIGHQVGAVAGVPHGHCSCVMLPAVLRYNADVNGERQAQVSAALGRPDMTAADAVAELVAELGLPGRLRDAGVRREQFEVIVRGALDNLFVRQNPRPITGPQQVYQILELAW